MKDETDTSTGAKDKPRAETPAAPFSASSAYSVLAAQAQRRPTKREPVSDL